MFSLFVPEIKRAFDHLVQGKDAAEWLPSLHQGSQSVTNYSTKCQNPGSKKWAEGGSFTGGFGLRVNKGDKERTSHKWQGSPEALISRSVHLNDGCRKSG